MALWRLGSWWFWARAPSKLRVGWGRSCSMAMQGDYTSSAYKIEKAHLTEMALADINILRCYDLTPHLYQTDKLQKEAVAVKLAAHGQKTIPGGSKHSWCIKVTKRAARQHGQRYLKCLSAEFASTWKSKGSWLRKRTLSPWQIMQALLPKHGKEKKAKERKGHAQALCPFCKLRERKKLRSCTCLQGQLS
eukprot:1149543-Pelagomonas_calceolata.AAC.2